MTALTVKCFGIGKYYTSIIANSTPKLRVRRGEADPLEAIELFELLVLPATQQLKSKDKVILVPDDVLWSLPFQALQTAEHRFLLEDYALSYVPSLTSKVYVGSEARENRMKNEGSGFRVLHLATHGIVNNVAPMYSQLILAPRTDAKEDGVLEMWEIMNLKLNADLVVLSACDTALGKVQQGEGIIGLAWSLFVSGSPTTVASQWKVDSGSTTMLMLDSIRT